jgi:hypothetical protein
MGNWKKLSSVAFLHMTSNTNEEMRSIFEFVSASHAKKSRVRKQSHADE